MAHPKSLGRLLVTRQ